MARYSYSKISTYMKCPRKFKHSYIDQLPRKQAGPAADRGTQIHKGIEDFILGKSVIAAPPIQFYEGFLTELKEAGAIPEKPFAVDLNWQVLDIPVPEVEHGHVGFLDAILPHPDELVIYDWKTGKIYDEHYNQREYYGIIGLCLYPDYDRVRVENVYTDAQDKRFNIFFKEELEEAKNKWEDRIKKIESDELFPPNPQFACRWCDFSAANGGPCPF